MNFDVIVIGAGIVGMAVTHRLANAGLHVACIGPRSGRRRQASAAAGGMLGVFSEVSPHDPPERREGEVRQRWRARGLYERFIAELAEQSGLPILETRGLFVIANPAGEDDGRALAAMRAAAQQCNSRTEDVPARAVPGLNPQMGCAAFDALFLNDEGTVDTGQLLDALQACLQRDQHITCYDASVERLSLDPQTPVTVRLDSNDVLSSAQVVLACGAQIPQLLHASQLDSLNVPAIFAGRGVSLLARSLVDLPHAIRTPNRGFACGLHLVPRSNQLTYIGATNRFSTMPDFDREASLGEIQNLLSGAIREINTALKSAELHAVAVGYRPLTLDKTPVVGRTADPRVLVASGTYRNGVLLAPLIAQLIDEEIAQAGRHAQHRFSPQRPSDGAKRQAMHPMLERASQSLVATLCDPGGQLPDSRSQDLQRFIYAMLSLTLDPEYDRHSLLQRIERLMARAPIEENVPLLFDMIARYA